MFIFWIFRTHAAPAALLPLLLLTVACGGEDAVTPQQPPTPVGTIPDQVVVTGETTTLDVSSYFEDPDGGALTYASASSIPAVVSVGQSGSSLALVGVREGAATVTVTATDPDRLTASQSFQATVLTPNRPPESADTIPAQTVTVGRTATLDLSDYFRDPDGDRLSYSAASNRENVMVASVSGTRLILGGVAPGTGAATVTAADPDGLTATQTVAVTVKAANRAPEASGAIPAIRVAVEDTTRLDLSSYFRDPDGDELSYTAVSDGDGEVAAATTSDSTLIVAGLAAGSASVTVTAADPGGLTATQTAAVTVFVPNAAPEPVGAIPEQSVSAGDTVMVDLSRHFRDPDGDDLSFSAASDDEDVATATIAGSTLAVAGLRAGTTSVSVTAADSVGLEATQTFAVSVMAGIGGLRDDFDSPASLDDWEIFGDGTARIADGLLDLRPADPTVPLLAERPVPLPLTSWKIRASLGRRGPSMAPAVLWYTGDSRIPAVRFEIGNRLLGLDYVFAWRDVRQEDWFWAQNVSGNSEAIRDGREELTEVTIEYDDGVLVITAGDTELHRVTISNRDLLPALRTVTRIAVAGFGTSAALFDYVDVSGIQGAAAMGAHADPAWIGSGADLIPRSGWNDFRLSRDGGIEKMR